MQGECLCNQILTYGDVLIGLWAAGEEQQTYCKYVVGGHWVDVGGEEESRGIVCQI